MINKSSSTMQETEYSILIPSQIDHRLYLLLVLILSLTIVTGQGALAITKLLTLPNKILFLCVCKMTKRRFHEMQVSTKSDRKKSITASI